jgi:hypothetical protein
MPNLKWNDESLKAYKAGGKEMRLRGYKAIRELKDLDNKSCLTFWAAHRDSIIQQTFSDTGNIVWWRAMTTAEFDEVPAQ